jgi:hypothetical protein
MKSSTFLPFKRLLLGIVFTSLGSLVSSHAATLAYYDFSTDGANNTLPATLHDTSGNGYDVTRNGANSGTILTAVQPSWSTDPSLRLSIGGIDDYQPANASVFNSAIAPSQSFTIEMSISGTAFVDGMILSTVEDSPVNTGFYWALSPAGALSLVSRTAGGGSVTDPTNLQTNTWYALALTYDGSGKMDMYVNKILVGSNASFTFSANPSYGFVLGQFKPGAGVYTGLRYNQIRFSDTVLSTSQMLGPVPEPNVASLVGLGVAAMTLRVFFPRRRSNSSRPLSNQ